MRRWDKQVNTNQILKMWKFFSNGPPFGSFLREKWKSLIFCQNDQWVKMIIFCKLDHFWAALWAGTELGNNSKIIIFRKAKKCGKNCPMVPPFDHFQRKNENRSSLARTISGSRRSFFVNLATFERRSGLKKFSLLKIAILKMGWLSKFQSHRSWGDAHLSFGAAQAPPN